MSRHLDSAAVDVAERSIQRARDALNILEREPTPDQRWHALCRQVDPQRMIKTLMREQLTGADREASDELDRRFRRTESNSGTIPWQTLAHRAQRQMQTRADLASTLSTGGYLIETQNYPTAAGALLSLLILGRLGATGISSTANLNLPKINASSSPYWLSTETTQITESDQTFGQLAFSPRTVGGYTEMSRLLVLQSSPDAAQTVAMDLTRKIARAIEAAAFNGSGVAGQPKGLLSMSGVNSVSGASFSLSTVASAVSAIGDGLEPDTNPGWAAARSVAITLRQRQEFTNGTRALWEGPATVGTLADYNAAASSGVPSATAIFGAWKFLTLVDFGGGLVVSVNPYGSASAGGGPRCPEFPNWRYRNALSRDTGLRCGLARGVQHRFLDQLNREKNGPPWIIIFRIFVRMPLQALSACCHRTAIESPMSSAPARRIRVLKPAFFIDNRPAVAGEIVSAAFR